MSGKPIRDNTVNAPKVVLGDIKQCIKDLKRNKAGGCDSITNEHLIFGDCRLMVHLSLHAMLQHSFVCSDFCKGIIIPLLKDKHGDATSLDMYRGITFGPALHCQKFLNQSRASAMISLLATSSNLVLKRRVAACMHCLQSMSLLG